MLRREAARVGSRLEARVRRLRAEPARTSAREGELRHRQAREVVARRRRLRVAVEQTQRTGMATLDEERTRRGERAQADAPQRLRRAREKRHRAITVSRAPGG